MTPLRTFHGTARGSLHILRNAPCEDSSASYADEDGRYYIAVVSDGHGDSRCFRSQYGSKFATEVALSSLKEFAEYAIQVDCKPVDLVNDSSTIRQLTDTIVARWYDSVTEDFHNAAPTAEELATIGAASAEDISEDAILHIYGATLIAALWLPNMLVLLQQGDGRCDVFYSDGTINQPIPWDDRCVNTTTTSLCDSDADERFRNCVIDLREIKVAACYLACDGIEDAYRDSVTTMEGTHTFFKDLSCKLMKMDERSFCAYLEEFLPEFSRDGLWGKSGSGDDCSVAGIVDMNLLATFEEQFLKDIQIYQLSEELFWKTDELNGKTRKYEILRRRMEEAGQRYDESKTDRERIKRRLTSLRIRQSDLLASLKEENTVTEQMLQSSQKATSALEEAFNDESSGKSPIGVGGLDSISSFIKDVFSFSAIRKNSMGKRRRTQAQIYKEFQDCAMQCSKNEKELEAACKDVDEKKSLYTEAKEKFKTYESVYKAIEKAINDIQAQLREAKGLPEIPEPVLILASEESAQAVPEIAEETSSVDEQVESHNNDLSEEKLPITEDISDSDISSIQQGEAIDSTNVNDHHDVEDSQDASPETEMEATIDESISQSAPENTVAEQITMWSEVETPDDQEKKSSNSPDEP